MLSMMKKLDGVFIIFNINLSSFLHLRQNLSGSVHLTYGHMKLITLLTIFVIIYSSGLSRAVRHVYGYMRFFCPGRWLSKCKSLFWSREWYWSRKGNSVFPESLTLGTLAICESSHLWRKCLSPRIFLWWQRILFEEVGEVKVNDPSTLSTFLK